MSMETLIQNQFASDLVFEVAVYYILMLRRKALPITTLNDLVRQMLSKHGVEKDSWETYMLSVSFPLPKPDDAQIASPRLALEDL